MRKISIVASTVVLIFFGLGSTSVTERDGRGNSREPVEKMFSVEGETLRLRATITDDCSAIEIMHASDKTQSGSTEDVTKIVARVVVRDLVPEAYDFALSRSGRMLWLVAHSDELLPGGRKLTVYPLLRDNETQQYDFVRIQVSVAGGRHIAAASSLDLIRLLEEIGRDMRKKGTPFSLGLKPTIADLRIECPKGESAIVSGKIGAKYSFSGEVSLEKNNRVGAKDFKINEIDQQENFTK